MTPDPQIAQAPHATATDQEWRAYLGGLLEHVSNQGVAALRLQGFTDQDMFELRRLAHSVSTTITPRDLASLRRFADMLEPR